MKHKLTRSPFWALALAFALLMVPTQEAAAVQTDNSVERLELNYEAGQLITISASINRAGDDAAEARRTYFERVLPIAGPLGLRRDGSLRPTETVRGNFHPAGLSFFSWPSAEAEASLSAHPDWSAIKALRPIAWDELRLYSVVLEEDLELVFRSDRFYTVAVGWIDAEYPGSYDQYLDTIAPALAEMGARFMYRMESPRFERNNPDTPAPDRMVFVEWQNADDLELFLGSEAFSLAAPLLIDGLSRFELHRVAPVFPANG